MSIDSPAIGDQITAAWADLRPPAAAGVVTTGAVVANTPKSVAITFPSGRFDAAPNVCVSAASGSPAALSVGVTTISSSGATLWVNSTIALGGGATLEWIATQNL